MVTLSFKKTKNPKNFPIQTNILKETEVNWQGKVSIIETYIQHAEITVNYTQEFKEVHSLQIWNKLRKIEESLQIKTEIADLGFDRALDLRLGVIKHNVEEYFSNLPPLEYFSAGGQLSISVGPVVRKFNKKS